MVSLESFCSAERKLKNSVSVSPGKAIPSSRTTLEQLPDILAWILRKQSQYRLSVNKSFLVAFYFEQTFDTVTLPNSSWKNDEIYGTTATAASAIRFAYLNGHDVVRTSQFQRHTIGKAHNCFIICLLVRTKHDVN